MIETDIVIPVKIIVPKPVFQESLKSVYGIKRGMNIRGIVLHSTAGGGKHNDTVYLAHPGDGRKVGVDFTIERDGSIWRLTPNEVQYAMPHAGKDTLFKGLSNGKVNRITVGIELTQHVRLELTPMWPDAQVRACAHLCASLAQTHGLFPADIVTHRQISISARRSDPRQFPFSGENGFWRYFWDVQGKGAEYLASLMPTTPFIPPVDPSTLLDTHPSKLPLLRLDPRGDVNDEDIVEFAQKLLKNRHNIQIDVDRYFGPLMLVAVKKFQALKGLVQDGKIGPNTWAKLL